MDIELLLLIKIFYLFLIQNILLPRQKAEQMLVNTVNYAEHYILQVSLSMYYTRRQTHKDSYLSK